MPTNLYGEGDNYHPENSHVIPGMIYRFHQAKINNLPKVIVWGTDSREFLYVDDMARAAIHIMNLSKKFMTNMYHQCSHINVGSSNDLTIENCRNRKRGSRFKGEIHLIKQNQTVSLENC